MDSKLAVHHRIRVRTDLRGAYGMAEARRGGPRQVDLVLPADSFRTRNDLGLADTVKGGLTPQFPGRLDRFYNSIQIVIGAQMVCLDDGWIAPVCARESYLSAAGRLNQRRRDRKTLFGGRRESGRRFWRCDRELLKH